MIGPQHVCVLYVATAGLQGSLMGSDEQDIVLLIYVIVDVTQNKVVGVQQYVLRPTTADDPSALNILSEQLTTASALTEELVRAQGRCLEDAMQEFETYCRSLHLDPHGAGFRLVTDGQPPLRQCLHPEACRKGLQLPRYYSQFVDLRKEVKAYVDGKEEQDLQIGGIGDMLECLALKVEAENEFYKKEAKDMVNIVQKLIAEGHRFECVENISIVLEPGICSKNDVVDSNCVVRVRGLPWQSSDQDIANFFRGLNVSKGGVALCLSAQGRRNGEALVRFENSEHREMALKRHKHHIGTRYLEIYRASGDDFLEVAGGASTEAQAFLSRGATVIVRMRGLPYDCTAKQVLDFFMAGENSCSVLDGTEGVLFVKKPDGRATGDAFVLFSSETDAPKALSKHRECIGSRYIELFRSTTAEVQQVLNRSMKTHEPPAPLLPTIPQISYLPQHIITSGTRKDCIRLRGLPYEAHVEHILDFLGDYSKNIVFQGVHMVYNAQGQPSGEAFIQMDSEQSAFMTAQQKHNNFMLYGKKQRYIEVFQCSGEDMNMVLTGGLPPAPPNSKVSTPALLSPGMLPSPAVVSPYPPPPATTNMPPPPPPPTSVAQLSSQAPPPYWPPADLAAAQQQAQLIAQQNLLARQTQNQQAAAAHNEHMLLMNQIAQHNYTFINQSIAGGDLGAAAMLKPPHALQFVPASAGMHPYVMLPPRMSPFAFHKPPPMAAYAGPMTPMVPGPMSAMKRSYSDAFSEPTNPAKRPYTGPVPLYQPFYPNMQ